MPLAKTSAAASAAAAKVETLPSRPRRFQSRWMTIFDQKRPGQSTVSKRNPNQAREETTATKENAPYTFS